MTPEKTVLIVDDEPMIRASLSAYLSKMGWNTVTAENGTNALALFSETPVQFVLLDLMLPGLSGEEVCREIRSRSQVPIIMLTAKTQEESILNGLGMGADDYVTKPFSVKQLYARMEAVLRRSGSAGTPSSPSRQATYPGGLQIDLEANEASINGSPVSLTPSEWKILSALVRHPKKIFSREELMDLAFGADSDSLDRAIDTHIKNLRKKIEADSKNPVYVKTVHGLGYKFGGGDAL